MAEQHQKAGEPEPISLLTIYTPRALIVTEAEFALRGRAVQLSNRFGNETSAVDAITQIMEVLKQEGLAGVEFQRDHLKRISDDLVLAEQDNHEDLVSCQIIVCSMCMILISHLSHPATCLLKAC